MGKIRDWCLATGLEETKYRAQDFKVSSSVMKVTSYKLPAPYNRKVPGQAERDIQKLGLALMSQLFPFSTRLEGSGKIISTKSGAGVMVGSAQSGLPDSIGVRNGILHGIEFKCAGGSVSAIQYAKLKELHLAGARVCICVDPCKIREWVHIGTYTSRIDDWLEVL